MTVLHFSIAPLRAGLLVDMSLARQASPYSGSRSCVDCQLQNHTHPTRFCCSFPAVYFTPRVTNSYFFFLHFLPDFNFRYVHVNKYPVTHILHKI